MRSDHSSKCFRDGHYHMVLHTYNNHGSQNLCWCMPGQLEKSTMTFKFVYKVVQPLQSGSIYIFVLIIILKTILKLLFFKNFIMFSALENILDMLSKL